MLLVHIDGRLECAGTVSSSMPSPLAIHESGTVAHVIGEHTWLWTNRNTHESLLLGAGLRCRVIATDA
jgi:hypothetical protein